MTAKPSSRRPGPGPTGLRKRSLAIAGHRTSLALEPEFWAALEALALARAATVAGLVAMIDEQRAAHAPERPLASAVRVHVLSEALKRSDQLGPT